MADDGGGAAAPYKPRKRRKLLAKKVATGLKVRKPPVRQVGGGVAAPGPITTEPVKTAPPFAGRKPIKSDPGLTLPNGKRYLGRGKAVGLRKPKRGSRRRPVAFGEIKPGARRY